MTSLPNLSILAEMNLSSRMVDTCSSLPFFLSLGIELIGTQLRSLAETAAAGGDALAFVVFDIAKSVASIYINLFIKNKKIN
jgi:hypothetical protein